MAMGVNSTLPQTSPNAKMLLVDVFCHSSASMYVLPSTSFTPALSRFNDSVLGTRPGAYKTISASFTSPSPTSALTKCAVFFELSSCWTSIFDKPIVFRWIVIPCRVISASKKSEMSSSKFLNALCFRTTRCVSTPSPLRTPASSTAMYPAPTTTALDGKSSIAKNPSDVMQRSFPGISGMSGRPPTAIKILSLVTFWTSPPLPPPLAVTATVCSSTNVASPMIFVTPALANPPS
mmetsp:Transcript_43035/g.104093  ORF Transcript_43035/g.104093 Transcript_43035/m.104093 type:complete len:235 (+) Transcript_43035:652-1356(+)